MISGMRASCTACKKTFRFPGKAQARDRIAVFCTGRVYPDNEQSHTGIFHPDIGYVSVSGEAAHRMHAVCDELAYTEFHYLQERQDSGIRQI